ncbi:hypothetical protein ACWF9B_08700 [Streptomyces sp. NPDC055089]
MDHPLTAVLDRVDPDAEYCVADLAALLRMARNSIHALVAGGWFPGGAQQPIPATGGRRTVWSGAALIAATEADLPPLDHDRYAPATLWRMGCGCDGCLAWHNADSRTRRRGAADAAFPEQQRRQVLELIAAGDVTSIVEAAERAGVVPGRVFGRACRDADFRATLDEAAAALCVGGDLCGRPNGYRTGCRGTACRRAHRPLTA